MEKKRLLAFYVCILFGLTVLSLGYTMKQPPTPLPIFIEETKIPQSPSPKIKRMLVTAYCPCKKCCGQYADGKTSIGRNAWKTFGVAADPNLLSYRTKVKIPNIGIREVDDTGGAMRQSTKKGICHIDLRFHSHEKALQFGRQWLNVEILN